MRKEETKNRLGKYLVTILFLIGVFGYSALSILHTKDSFLKTIASADFHTVDGIGEFVSSLEADMQENVYERYRMIEAYGMITKTLGKHEVNGFDYVIDKNGYLFSGNFWANVHDRDVSELALTVEKLYQQLQSKNTQMLVLSFPQKYSTEWTDGYAGIPYDDFSYDMSMFMAQIRKYQIPNLDCLDILENSDLEYDKMYFKTDHHWKPLAAFTCFVEVTNKLEEMGFDVDPDLYYRDFQNYTVETFPQMMLGSEGRSAGISFSGLEDFDLIYLDDQSHYEYEGKSKSSERSFQGSLKEALIDYDTVEKIQKDPDKIYSKSMYDMYLHGVQYETTIENMGNEDGPNILFLRDSYADPLATFMAPYCSHIDMLWTKYLSAETVQEYIQKNDYDLVIVGYYPDDISSRFFNFIQ